MDLDRTKIELELLLRLNDGKTSINLSHRCGLRLVRNYNNEMAKLARSLKDEHGLELGDLVQTEEPSQPGQ